MTTFTVLCNTDSLLGGLSCTFPIDHGDVTAPDGKVWQHGNPEESTWWHDGDWKAAEPVVSSPEIHVDTKSSDGLNTPTKAIEGSIENAVRVYLKVSPADWAELSPERRAHECETYGWRVREILEAWQPEAPEMTAEHRLWLSEDQVGMEPIYYAPGTTRAEAEAHQLARGRTVETRWVSDWSEQP